MPGEVVEFSLVGPSGEIGFSVYTPRDPEPDMRLAIRPIDQDAANRERFVIAYAGSTTSTGAAAACNERCVASIIAYLNAMEHCGWLRQE